MLKNLKQFLPPEIEEKVLEFWKTNDIFKKSLKLREKSEPFIFYEGPPYANGRPGIHHVLARVFKDIVLRYKTMRGYHVPRRAGWDTHGLPIELEAERQLGIKNKKEIEKFGVALFNQKARESIWHYKDEWEKMTERIGYWLDLKNAYITYKNDYIESLWWVFSEVAKKKLLKKDYKVVPYCPRCETVLSQAELGQPGVYRKVPDPSVYIKFKLRTSNVERRTQKSRAGGLGSKSAVRGSEYLLVWTTTPWTLPANVAVAVHPGLTYTKYEIRNAASPKAGEPRSQGEREYLWSYSSPPPLEGKNAEAVEKISGKKLIGLEYEPLYSNSKFQIPNSKFYHVFGADFVSTEEGTGLVHIAPAFGEDDFNLIKDEVNGFGPKDMLITIDNSGKVVSGYPGAGKFVKEADKDIVNDLKSRGLIYKAGVSDHEYPFCWRCSTPLLYFARSSWFILMSKLRKQLVTSNKKINWIPEHIREGRFGQWIKEERDWAISRERFWGTPLPIWECGQCGTLRVIGSLPELDKHAYFQNKFLLLRHTEAEHNLKDVIASGEEGKNVPLTEKGLEDAKALAKKLSGKVDVIYASPYKRTLDLAKMIAGANGIKAISDKRLEEGNFGIFNNRPVREHKAFFASPMEEFTKTPPSGENLNDVKKRMFEFLRDINTKNRRKTILVISHGDPLWVLEGAMLNKTNEEILAIDYIKNGDVREVPLHNFPYDADGNLDLHKPFIDEIYLECGECKEKTKRVTEIADVWFDSGAMPFASVHFPFTQTRTTADLTRTHAEKSQHKSVSSQHESALSYPADFICEAIDQTRGWFHTLLAVSTLLGYKAPYKNVICLGLINDKFGQKMSKSKGNVVNPWDIISKYGIDAVRWYFYTVNPPGEPKSFDENEVKKTLNRVINILYNSYVFYDTYALKNLELRTSNLEQKTIKTSSRSLLDKWILARLNQTIEIATGELEKYEIGAAAKAIEELIDDLSRWYIRRSRRRLQKPEDQKDYEICSVTLGYVLLEVSKLMAPFAPFFSEALYQTLHGSGRTLHRQAQTGQVLSVFSPRESVHLEDWSTADKKLIDEELLSGMSSVRDMATKALAKRAEAGIKVRQPLASLKVRSSKSKVLSGLLDILKDEINVKEIIFSAEGGSASGGDSEVELDTIITPELREEGIVREFTRIIQELRQKAGLEPKDKIFAYVEAADFMSILERKSEELKREIGAGKLDLKRTEKTDADISTKLENKEIWVGIKKHKT